MLGLDVYANAVAVAGGSANQALVQTVLAHQFLALNAVLVGILLEIQIVQQTHHAPELLFFAITQFLGKPAHDFFQGNGVL